MSRPIVERISSLRLEVDERGKLALGQVSLDQARGFRPQACLRSILTPNFKIPEIPQQPIRSESILLHEEAIPRLLQGLNEGGSFEQAAPVSLTPSGEGGGAQ